MRRHANRWPKRSVRAPIQVENLEERQLLTTTALPVGSTWSQYSVPLSVGTPVSAPLPIQATPGVGSSSKVTPALSPQSGGAYSPSQIRHAYGVDQLNGLDGTGQTIAIVDAYADPTAASDLAAFDTQFGLPAANLVVATPQSSEGPMVSNSGWDLETSLDIEWAHAIAPGAKILLVEAFAADDTDLLNAVTYAVSQGANQVSMSWGGGEYSGESSLNSYFNSPGVTYLASSGDSGGQMLFPAISPYVTSVGGTSLSLDSSGNRVTESAWSSGGGGQSSFITEPSFQQGFQSTGYRTTPDVAYDADPGTGVYVLDNGTWYGVGGTSAGAPQWAGLVALANQGRATQGETPLGTGQTFGTNSVLYSKAGGTSYSNPNGDFVDITTGSNGHSATTGYDEATGLGSPVANQLVPDLIGKPVTPTPTVPTIADPNFTQVSVGTGQSAYAYNPTGSPWAFSNVSYGNGSGLAGNGSAFTWGNANAPVGTQVAFLQGTGTITQAVGGWSAGSYTLSFDAAERANFGVSREDFEVLVDGQVVGKFLPTATSYQSYVTSTFTVTAGAHTIQFLGINTAGNDDTIFLDQVAVAVATSTVPPAPPAPPAPPVATVPTIADPNFTQVSVGTGQSAYAYNPTGSPWAFSNVSYGNGSGLAGNGSAFTWGNANAPVGTQVAFLQGTGTITQAVGGWSAGSYTLSFDAAERANFGVSREDFEVLVDGQVVGKFLPTATSYQSYVTSTFTVTAGAHTIQFLGINTAGNDDTIFLDQVAVATA